MPTYQTMSPDGLPGSDFTAANIDEASILAAQAGYKVLDIMDDLIVIAPERRPVILGGDIPQGVCLDCGHFYCVCDLLSPEE